MRTCSISSLLSFAILSTAFSLTPFGVTVAQAQIQMDSPTPELREATFAQHCFWTGERVIGAVEGVHKTEAGFYDGKEVTRVWYNPKIVSLQSLVSRAKRGGVAEYLYLSNTAEAEGINSISKVLIFERKSYRKAPDSDQKRQIQGTPFSKLSLNPFQATKVNAFARSKPQEALKFLNRQQRQSLQP